MKLRVFLAYGIFAFAVGVLVTSIYVPRPKPGAQGYAGRNPTAIAEFASQLQFRRYADTPAFRAVQGDTEDVYLWDASRKVTGDLLPPKNQGSVGSCVGFGTASAVEHLLCVQIATTGQGSFKPISPEAIYGGSRFEIGRLKYGSTLHTNGDGSVGSWAAQWANQYGLLTQDAVGGPYDETRCRAYGRNGVPDALEPTARASPVRAVTQVYTWEETLAALRNGHPMTICSNTGFTAQRDRDGFCTASGQWAHCMAVIGSQDGNRPGVFILNSWGTGYHRGPSGAGNPSPAGFWCDKATFLRMIRQGECWAFGDAVGFPARKLKWIT